MQIEAINTAGALAREGDGGRVGIFASEGTAKIVTAVAGDDRQFAQRAFGTIRFWVGVTRKKRCLRRPRREANSTAVIDDITATGRHLNMLFIIFLHRTRYIKFSLANFSNSYKFCELNR